MKDLCTDDRRLQKSQRNWRAEFEALKRGTVQDAPLISRTTEKDDNLLLDPRHQYDLFQQIKAKVAMEVSMYTISTWSKALDDL
jgi:hypothetical protein